MVTRFVLVVAAVLAVLIPVVAQEVSSEADVTWRIRREATENSQIMRTLHVLTDRFGPRLTGSPNLRLAGEWAIEQLGRWGLQNGRLEPWDFGHPGWLNERLSAHILSPVRDHLVGEVLAWTPGTNGVVRGQAIRIPDPPRGPTQEELTAFLDGIGPRVPGRIVLVGEPERVEVSFNVPSKRREDADVRAQYAPDAPPPGPPPFVRQQARLEEGRLGPNQVTEQLDRFLVARGALVRVNDAGRDHGQIRAFHNRTFDVSMAVPTVILRHEDYGRIARLLDDGPVELEFEIVNRLYPEGTTAYNAIAEIPGTDKADEVIMLGGHLDSWHAATGATDNAIGCAVMMEAARILSALDIRPRRTIRVALWGGEEQGLLGSQAYVKEHFGSFEQPKPGFEKFGGYFNIDSGTGRARGATVFGPPAAAEILRAALAPFEDLGVLGATSTTSRRRGGSDHTSFNEAGLPGIGIGQDPIEYGSHSWHTNLDTYERIVPEDAVNSAIAIAAAVYHLAMRDDLLPRFPPDAMPKPLAPPPSTTTSPPQP